MSKKRKFQLVFFFYNLKRFFNLPNKLNMNDEVFVVDGIRLDGVVLISEDDFLVSTVSS